MLKMRAYVVGEFLDDIDQIDKELKNKLVQKWIESCAFYWE